MTRGGSVSGAFHHYVRTEHVPLEAAMPNDAAWRGADLMGAEGWSHRLAAAEVDELAAALGGVRARGLSTTAITRAERGLVLLA